MLTFCLLAFALPSRWHLELAWHEPFDYADETVTLLARYLTAEG